MKALVLFAIFATASAMAQPLPGDIAVAELSRCDATFFRALAAKRSALAQVAPLTTGETASSFAVADRKHPVRSRVMFRQPALMEGMSIVGYFDEYTDIPNGMSVYSWGYLVADSTVAKTAAVFRPLIWEGERLRDDGPVFVRSEVWSHDQPALGWVKVKTQAGVPRRGTVERVLLIEPYDGEPTLIRLGCSIQGNVTEPLLRDLRPDLRP